MNVKKFKFKKLASVLLIMAMLFSMMTTVGSAEDLPEGTVFKATFEDDEKQLSSTGGSSLAIVEGGYNSAYSLEISGRQVTYAGAGIDLSTLEGNTSYVVKARVMYNEGSQQSVNLNAQLSYTPSYKGKQWNSVANAKLQKGVWNYIEGVFFLEADTKAPLLYFQATDSANTSFYLDDVELLKVVVSGDTVKIGGEVKKVVATASPTPTNIPTPTNGPQDAEVPGNLMVNGNFNANNVISPWTHNQTWNPGAYLAWVNGYGAYYRDPGAAPAYHVRYDLKNILLANGAGTYTLTGKVRLANGDNTLATVSFIIDGGNWVNADVTATDHNWATFTLTHTFATVPNTCVIGVKTSDSVTNSTTEIDVDNFVLLKN